MSARLGASSWTARGAIARLAYAVVAAMALALASSGTARAQITTQETFFNTNAPGWILGGGALLTANGIDPPGQGWLRLTDDSDNQSGFAYFDTAITPANGVYIRFDYASWGGDGADGLTWFLFDGARGPGTFNPGAFGGSLGYAQRTSPSNANGVSGGWLGIGLDEFGNYSNPTEGRQGGPGSRPDAVAIRGVGNGLTGYPFIAGSGTLAQGIDRPGGSARPSIAGADAREVVMFITPGATPLATIRIRFGASNAFTTVLDSIPVPASPFTTVKLGFAASTGGQNNFHEVQNVLASNLADLQVVKTVNRPVGVVGDLFTFTVTVTNNGPGRADEVVVVDALPAGLAYVSATVNTGSFGVSGQNVTWSLGNVTLATTAIATITARATAVGTLVNTASTAFESDLNAADNSASASVSVLAGRRLSGTVYEDVNHDGARQAAEGSTGLGVTAKLVPAASPAGPAIQAVSVTAASGAYEILGVAAGAYLVLLDTNATLSDVTPGVPAGWIGTAPETLVRAGVVVVATDVTTVDFGLFRGGRLDGFVFADAGQGGGTANDGARQAGEPGLAGAAVRLTNDAVSTTFDATVTNAAGAFRLYIPQSAGAAALRVIETNPAGRVSTGGGAGTTGGVYTRATDTLRFTNALGTTYSAVVFGDVPEATLATDGAQTALPGTAVAFAHVFTAGTAGSVLFAISASALPATLDFAEVLYLDTNANGAVDAGETPLTGALAVAADERVAVVARVTSLAGTPFGAQDRIVLSATFTYTGASPALSEVDARADVLTIGEPNDAGLSLVKTADRASGRSGDVIEYTIRFTNRSTTALTTILVNDATPLFTTFVSADCVTPLPAGITACNLTTQPAVNGRGPIVWTLVGTLAPGASGTARFRVRID